MNQMGVSMDLISMNAINGSKMLWLMGLVILPLPLYAVDAASLRAKLNNYYEQQGIELDNEQRSFIEHQGDSDMQRQRRLREKLNHETVKQQRLQRRQIRQIEPWRRSFSAPGLQAPARGRARADSSTLQRFQRQQRQQRLLFRNQRRGLR